MFWHNEKRLVKDLKPVDWNPRKISEEQMEQLKKSIEKFNLVEIPAINANGNLLAGHQRIKALILLGRGKEEIDVRVPDRELTIEEEREYNLRSNKNTGEFDYDLLENFDEDLLKDVGFGSVELDKVYSLDSDEKDDIVPEESKEVRSQLGDLYILNEHCVLCGDSMNGGDVARLMDGKKADMVFTDPPYNVDYSGRGKNTSVSIENDNLTDEAFREFLNKTFKNYKSLLKDSGILYTCYASKTHREFEDALNLNNFEVKNQIIWVKLLASMGWGDYRWKHEPILYCHQKGFSSDFYGDRKEYTTWDEEKTDEQLLKWVKNLIKKEENGNSTVWRFGRDNEYKHPTQKPVQLIEKALINSSQREEIVADLFLGSGSTLIACEKTNRVCYGMELEPRYIDIIVQRYVDFTSNHEIIKNGEKITW